MQAIRKKVGRDFHLQMKISAIDYDDALDRRRARRATRVEDSIQVCKWLEAEGVDAIHVSTGSFFPHPKNPAGDLPIDELVKTYDTLISSGKLTLATTCSSAAELTAELFKRRWDKARGDIDSIEGHEPARRAARSSRRSSIPVICTGGFQTASVIRAGDRPTATATP